MKVWLTECDEWDHAYANATKMGALNDLIEYLRMESDMDEQYNDNYNAVVRQKTEESIREMQGMISGDATYLSFCTLFGNFYITQTEVGD